MTLEYARAVVAQAYHEAVCVWPLQPYSECIQFGHKAVPLLDKGSAVEEVRPVSQSGAMQ